MSIGRAQTDTFPAVKKECCNIIILVSSLDPNLVQKNFKSFLLRGLVINSQHQHHKVRSMSLQVVIHHITCMQSLQNVLSAYCLRFFSPLFLFPFPIIYMYMYKYIIHVYNMHLQALGVSVACLSMDESATAASDFNQMMRESIIPLFTKLLSDHSSQPRMQLADTCKCILVSRLGRSDPSTLAVSSTREGAVSAGTHEQGVSPGIETVAILVTLLGDVEKDVQSAADRVRTEPHHHHQSTHFLLTSHYVHCIYKHYIQIHNN